MRTTEMSDPTTFFLFIGSIIVFLVFLYLLTETCRILHKWTSWERHDARYVKRHCERCEWEEFKLSTLPPPADLPKEL